MGAVSVDDPNGPKAPQAGPEFLSGKRSEPAQVDVAHLLPLLPEPPYRRAGWQGHCTQADQHYLGVLGHELVKERGGIAVAKDLVELPIALQDDLPGPSGGLPVLPP